MSIRLKVFLIIMAIVVAISASSVIISVSSAQTQILKTLEVDMRLVASLANEYVSGEIELLKANAAAVAQRLKTIPPRELESVLIEQLAAYGHFQAITIFNAAGKVEASYGSRAAPEEIAATHYGKEAFEGRRTISTTYFNSGHPVFYVFVPMDDHYLQFGEKASQSRIVVCTVPGVYFSEQLNRFLIWDTGNIAMGDRTGTIIANVHYEWVRERVNFMALAEESYYEGASRAIQRMIAGELGTDRFVLDGVDSVIAYMPVTASGEGWYLAVIAPVEESPFYKVRVIIAIAGIIFLGLGLIVAAFSSGSIAKPFYQLRKQNAQLIELNGAAQAASKTKSRFLANMSHEMRTPLNAIIGFSELTLKEEGLASGIETSFKKIYESGIVLLGIVDNLLDISNMESEKFAILPAEYDFARFVNDTANLNRIRIGAKPISFKIVLDKNLPARLIGDELRVKQIFNNLLGNAFSFTSEGYVEWRISAESDGDSVWLKSSVSDTGTGIKPEDINKIFVDYKNMDTTEKQTLEGTGLGLGLALSQKIAGLMDGLISVESTPGKGSVFTVRIRQASAGSDVIGNETAEALKKFKYTEQKRIDNAEMEHLQLPGKRVLVVDDIEINFEVAKGMLDPYRMQVDYAESGAKAIELVRKGEPRYDAIFMDHMMPGIDGIETVRIIREVIGGEYAEKIPIIVVTANVVTGQSEAFMACGFQDFLAKPMDAGSVDRVIRNWIVRQDYSV
ncbi:MAG: response regulator [Treponema sp.]|nr:response regulator [Treponema sp.]